MNKIWEKEEDDILIKHYNSGSKEFILSLLPNREWESIRIRANRINLKRLNYFTNNELDFIKNNWEIMTIVEMGSLLNRSPKNIGEKAKKMNLSIKQEKWSEDDDFILKNNFGIYSVDYISKFVLPNRTKSSIYHRCQELNLSNNTNRYSKDELLISLKELSEKLGRTPTIIELPYYGLAHYSAYTRAFGSYNNVCLLLGIEINKTIFKQSAHYFSKNGDICYSKSEQIITDFLIDNNIHFIKDKYYSSICKNGDCGRKRFDWLIDGVIVEYFGLSRNKKYQRRMQEKINLCNLNNINLLQIFDKDILRLNFVFQIFIKS